MEPFVESLKISITIVLHYSQVTNIYQFMEKINPKDCTNYWHAAVPVKRERHCYIYIAFS